MILTVDFATFCYSGDTYRLHYPGHLEKQVLSNGYAFNSVIVVYQNCDPHNYGPLKCPYRLKREQIKDIDKVLLSAGIDLNKSQYSSNVDNHHTWKNHVVNHLAAIQQSTAEYIVFADIDCWIVLQPSNYSWIERGIRILQNNPDVFMVSPNDGEPERKTQTISQQMFMVKVNDFKKVNWNQPGYSGNPRDYPEMPEYHAMGEGRIHYYCQSVNKYRYVLGPEYRYWHFNRINSETNMFETNLEKYR